MKGHKLEVKNMVEKFINTKLKVSRVQSKSSVTFRSVKS